MNIEKAVGVELRIRVPERREVHGKLIHDAALLIDKVLVRPSHQTLIVTLDVELIDGYLICVQKDQVATVSKAILSDIFQPVVSVEMLVVIRDGFGRPDFSICQTLVKQCSSLNARIGIYKYDPIH